MWRVTRDLVDYVSELEVIKDSGGYLLDDIGLTIDERVEERYSVRANQFASPRGEVQSRIRFSRDDWVASALTRTVMTCDVDNFYVHAELDAYHGTERVLSLNWSHTVPREGV